MQTVWVSLVGMVVFLDTTALGQLMICQPLIICPFWGFLVGRPEIGLFFGVTFQLIWLASLPVGAAKFPEGNLGAFIATAIAAEVYSRFPTEPLWSLLAVAAVIGILSAQLGRNAIPMIRRLMNSYAPRIQAAAESGNTTTFALLFAGATGVHAATGFLFTAVCYSLGTWLMISLAKSSAYSIWFSKQTEAMFVGIWPSLLGAGAAVLAYRFIQKSNLLTFATAATVIGGAWLWLH